MNLRARAAAIAWFFLAIGCYTLLAPIDGPSSIGAPVLSRSAAIVLAASLVIAALVAAASLRAALDDDGVRAARPRSAAVPCAGPTHTPSDPVRHSR